MSIRNRQQGAQSRGSNYWISGIHAVGAALANPERQIIRLQVTRAMLEKMQPFLKHRKGLQPEVVDPKELDKRFSDAVHQGVVLEVKPLDQPSLDEVLAGEVLKPLLFLDQVTDPHNIGAILRSAAAFDAGAVIVTRDHSPEEGGVMAKSASGALDAVPLIRVTNLTQAMEEAKQAGYWVAGLDGEAKQSLQEAKMTRKTVLVLGAEGKGLRRLTAERCDLLVKLPISARMESLNVSNAAAVALYELSRGAIH